MRANDAGGFDHVYDYYCIYSSPDGTEELTLPWATISAYIFAERMNQVCM